MTTEPFDPRTTARPALTPDVAAELTRTGAGVEIDPAPGLARRGLFLGAGAALAVGALAVARPAAAEPGTPGLPGVPGGTGSSATRRNGRVHTDATPVGSTSASAPVSGYTYRHVGWMDFSPESSATRQWSSRGAYASASVTLWASVEIPAGALVRDIEWYGYNGTASPITALGRIWTAGVSTLYPTLADTSIPIGSDTTVRRSVVSSSAYGPHPSGTKIALGYPVTSDASAAVSGARVGFSQGAGMIGLLPAPVRAYDSRVSGGKLAAGSTRTITLPSSLVPAGTSGVVVNVTVTAAEGGGHLTVYPGNVARPDASSLNYMPGGTIANAMIVGVPTSRQIKVYAHKKLHLIIDVSGTVG